MLRPSNLIFQFRKVAARVVGGLIMQLRRFPLWPWSMTVPALLGLFSLIVLLA